MSQLLKHHRIVAYVACADERKIVALQLSPKTGDVQVLQEVSVPGAEGPSVTSMPLALHPAKHFLYAGVRAPTFPVASFAIDPSSGKLHFRTSGHLADNTVFMKIDRSGQFLMAASYSGSTLSLHRLEREGVVCSPPLMHWETSPQPHSIMFDPSNRSFYVACLGGDVVLNYSFDADKGAVTPNPTYSIPVQDKAGPRHQALHPNGRFLFVLNELAASISVLDLGTSPPSPARVVQTLGLDLAGGDREHAAADIHLSPLGRFLYASERTTNLLTGFAVDPDTGSLTHIGAWETEASPRSLAIDPTGGLLMAAGQISNHVSVYRIESRSGLLTRLFRFATPPNPSWIEIVCFP